MLTLSAAKVVITSITIFAQLLTCFRLSYRWRSNFWFDDIWAGLSLVCSIIGLVSFWIGIGPAGSVTTWWMRSLMLTFVVWSARMSILYSTIRIVPPSLPLRKVTYILAGFFVMMWVAQVTQQVVLCVRNKTWETLDPPRCTPASSVVIFEICTDVVSDLLLIGLPIRILWDIDIGQYQKKLLLVLLPASLVVTLLSIAHTYLVLNKAEILVQDITASLEASIASLVANFAVIFSFFYTTFRPVVNESGSRASSLGDDAGMRTLGKHISVRRNLSITGFGPHFREQEFQKHFSEINATRISLPFKLQSRGAFGPRSSEEIQQEANASFTSKGLIV